MRWSLALLTAVAAVAVAAPAAQAEDLTLDLMAHGTITMHSSMNTGTATEVVDASVDLEHQIDDLFLPEGQTAATSRWLSQRLFATRIGSDYTQQTPGRTLQWSCSTVGEAWGSAGEVQVRRDMGDLVLDVGIQETLEGAAACSGDNEAGQTYRLINTPLRKTIRVPASALSDGGEIVLVRDLPATCIQGGKCRAVFNGSINLTREGEPAVEPTPAPQPGVGPAPTPEPGSGPTNPAKPTKSVKPKVKAKRTKRGAKVTVTCGAGCGGRISALSVARRRQIATKPFKTGDRSSKAVVLRFPKHTRGNVVINVRATPRGGSVTTQRLKLR